MICFTYRKMMGSLKTGYVSGLAAIFALSACLFLFESIADACIRSAPSVHFSPTRAVINTANTTKVYDLTITNNDQDETPGDCGTSNFALSILSQIGDPDYDLSSFSTGSTVIGPPTTTGNLAVGARFKTTLTVVTSASIDGYRLIVNVRAVDDASGNHSSPQYQGAGSIYIRAKANKGAGNLLKRDEEDLCHTCHLTERNTTSADPRWATIVIKTHNSKRTSKNKWGTFGWGVAGGKYGEFVCTTCHTGHDTKNIYLIK